MYIYIYIYTYTYIYIYTYGNTMGFNHQSVTNKQTA